MNALEACTSASLSANQLPLQDQVSQLLFIQLDWSWRFSFIFFFSTSYVYIVYDYVYRRSKAFFFFLSSRG